jgi:glycosyltransferase involved in cell wall biosynthesis
VQFLFLGGGTDVERLQGKASALKLSNVSFLPRVPASDIGPVLARADALLVHLKDDPLFRITIPSKTQAYMAAGRPILMALGGDAARLVEQADCGVVCETLVAMSPDERRALGENGRRCYDSMFSLSAGTHAFERLFMTLCPDDSVIPSSPATSVHG